MKRILTFLVVFSMLLSLVACGSSKEETNKETKAETEEKKTTETLEAGQEKADEVKEVNYSEEVPKALQGVWCDSSIEGILSLYAFRDDKVETIAVTLGKGGANFISGTYTVAVSEGQIKYIFSGATGNSNFKYEKNVLTLTNAKGGEIKKITAADLLAYLEQEVSVANHKGVICIADLIVNYFAGSAESSTATAKKDAANAAIRAVGEAALRNMRTETDKVEQLTWYQHKNQPIYTDICCYIYPYIGKNATDTWLRIQLDYTDAPTDAGWIFYKSVIYCIDGQNTTKTFSSSELSRDNDTEVWELADYPAEADDIQLLRKIAASNETIIRFQGNQYHYDHIVTQKEKAAILDVLAAYEYLSNT